MFSISLNISISINRPSTCQLGFLIYYPSTHWPIPNSQLYLSMVDSTMCIWNSTCKSNVSDMFLWWWVHPPKYWCSKLADPRRHLNRRMFVFVPKPMFLSPIVGKTCLLVWFEYLVSVLDLPCTSILASSIHFVNISHAGYTWKHIACIFHVWYVHLKYIQFPHASPNHQLSCNGLHLWP